jgi:formylglycine-generating enzyme required for sulfatase activity
MIRRVISLLIALAGAIVLYGWWQRGHDPSEPNLTPLATVQTGPVQSGELAAVDADSAGETRADVEPVPMQEMPDAMDASAERTARAGWTPTLVAFDHQDRNAPTVMLQRGDAALAAGRLIEPPGDNAIDYYYSVLDAASGNTRAKQGLARTLDRIESETEAALGTGDYPLAAKLLPVLEQLRPEDAAPAQLRKRLDAAEPQRLALERATRALERGRIDNGERSALGYYRAALAVEPENATARSGIAGIQQRLIDAALVKAKDNAFDEADVLLERASAADPAALQLLADARSDLGEERSRASAARLLEAHVQLDENDADQAQSLLEQALAIDPEATGATLVRERIRNVRLYGGFGEGQQFNDSFAGGGEGPAMVVIPVGSFLMGSPDDEDGRRTNEGPQFRVRFDHGFALAQSEITVAEFRRFVEAAKYRTRAEETGGSPVYDERSGSMRERSGVDWRKDESGQTAGDNQPVVHVGWDDAVAYARWLAEQTGRAYRLPSEAEFEYALRAGGTTRYPWGNAAPSPPLANVSTTGDRSRSRREWSNALPGTTDGFFGIAPVRQYAANEFGLHDLAGNVSEWVEDCWHSSYSRAPSDGRAWVNPGCVRRVVRGASWASGPEQVRSAYRLSIAPGTTSPRVGFRVARDL